MKMRPLEPIAKRAYELWRSKLVSILQDQIDWEQLEASERQVWLDIASLVWDYALTDTGD